MPHNRTPTELLGRLVKCDDPKTPRATLHGQVIRVEGTKVQFNPSTIQEPFWLPYDKVELEFDERVRII